MTKLYLQNSEARKANPNNQDMTVLYNINNNIIITQSTHLIFLG